MAKFCGHCGSPLNEQGLCPNCAPASAPQQAAPQQVTPQQAAYYTNMPQPAAPKKKVNKKVLIPLVAGAAALVIVAVVLIVALSRCGKSSTNGRQIVSSQPQAFVSTSYGKIVGRYNVSELTEEDKPVSDVTIEPYLDSQGFAQDGNVFYGIDLDDYNKWAKVTVTGTCTATKETWIDEPQLDNSVIGDGSAHFRDVGEFQVCGDSVIARVLADTEFRMSHKEENCRLIRVDKSGKSIEFIGDETVRAQEFVVYNGWIYYVDNGYTLNSGYMDHARNRVGIYKIKPDGSGKTCLFSEYEGGKDEYRYSNLGNAGGMTVCNGWIYFMDLSDSSSRLARIKLDGSGYEQLSTKSVSAFTMDVQHNKVYFLDHYYGVSNSDLYGLYELDLSSKSERTVVSEIRTYCYLTYDSGYLYFFSPGESIEKGAIKRLHLSDDRAQTVKMTPVQVTHRFDENDIPIVETSGEDTVKWEDLDSGARL